MPTSGNKEYSPGTYSYDPNIRAAQLEERVTNINTRFTNFETTITKAISDVQSGVAALANEVRTNQRPQWQAYSVMLAAVLAIGGLAYLPIREATTDLKAGVAAVRVDISAISDKYITRAELEWRVDRAKEDRMRTDNALIALSKDYLPRNEWTLRNEHIDTQVAGLSRRIDELRQDFGSTYSLKDALYDFRQRLERIEEKSKWPSPPPSTN